MILIPIAVIFLCLAVVQLWRRNWKNAGLHCGMVIICLLYYALCAQLAINRWQEKRMKEQAARITELLRELAEAGNRTTPPTVPSPAPSAGEVR